MDQLQSCTDLVRKVQLSEQLHQAHTANRESYQDRKDCPSEDARAVTELNCLINHALQIISSYEKSSYTVDILNRKSNRAMRAETVSTADAKISLAALNLADDFKAFRGYCSICCGEEEIMSVVLKKLDKVEENTSDFALNFPLVASHLKYNSDMVSSQSTCFQCALLLDRSVYQEAIAARIPAVEFIGPNKKYIVHQLYLALTAGLATGASTVVQLFAGILDHTLATKKWCAEKGDDDACERGRVLRWLLQDVLENCRCRENFSETGKWVSKRCGYILQACRFTNLFRLMRGMYLGELSGGSSLGCKRI